MQKANRQVPRFGSVAGLGYDSLQGLSAPAGAGEPSAGSGLEEVPSILLSGRQEREYRMGLKMKTPQRIAAFALWVLGGSIWVAR